MIKRIHGGNCLKHNIIDFSVNISPLGLPEGVRDIISKDTGAVLRYPEPASERLKSRLAALHSVGTENIAVGNGSIELIYLIPRALRIKKALIVTPTFSEYEFALKTNGSIPIFFNTCEQDDFRIDCAKIAGFLPRFGALFLCNPNNPTGASLLADEVLRLLRLSGKRETILILDEAFIEFAQASRERTVVSEAVKSGSLIILRSLTKLFAIPGLRLGYAIGHKKIIEKITGLQYPWNVNGLAQVAGLKALADKDYMNRAREFITKERRRMFEGLNNIKELKAYPSSANFILCKLQNASILSSKELVKRLLRDGIYIRDCGDFKGLSDRFFRVAVKKRDENNRLIKCIEKALL
ncbi:MAG: threonine-phosphate decarboxylase CobD [Candidatus Omnitrophota bacterium]|nr:threonine-phosphate decarboxylase CobD [Candidatus Omnitrophota bacterium]